MTFIYLNVLHFVILLAILHVCNAGCWITPVNGHVNIPNSWSSIPESASLRCLALTSVAIGDSVTSIGSNAFFGCPIITLVYNSSVALIRSSTFPGTQSTIETVMLGGSVTSIHDRAFYYCSSLVSVTIPNSVISIDHDAFQEAVALKTVYLYASNI